MQRLRLYDCRNSRLPEAIGLCKSDVLSIAQYVNAAQERLLQAKEAGDEGWWGTWAEIAFFVSQTAPYWTAPREVARLEVSAVCQNPVTINNQFYEYQDFGNGRMPKLFRACSRPFLQVMSRNSVATFGDLPSTSQYIQIYPGSDEDFGKRILFSGLDQNSKPIYTRDGLNPTNGIYATLQNPFVNLGTQMTSITGIQKDITVAPVNIFAMDPTTGVQTPLLTMEPGETTASYRRYYFSGLPTSCCQSGTVQNVTVTGIVKLDLIPVQVDTDYCLIQSLEAIIEECKSVRFSDMDTDSAKSLSIDAHKKAIGHLNGQLAHYLGSQTPAVNFRPFGSARLEARKIGTLI